MAITDHASLKYIKLQKTLSKQQARWLEVLQLADFIVKYQSGKQNKVADALLCLYQFNAITNPNLSLFNSIDITAAYIANTKFKTILETL